METICATYKILYNLSKEKKTMKNELYCDSMVVYQDSVWKLHKNKELMDMQEKYNQQKLLK